jgi:hypothetical protein
MQWLAALMSDGIAFLTDVPVVEGMAAPSCEQPRRPTILAYTPLVLGVHTDNPYREPGPGYHCCRGQLLLNRANISDEFNRIKLGKEGLKLFFPQFRDVRRRHDSFVKCQGCV